MTPKTKKHQQSECAVLRWNRDFPAGTRVSVRRDNGTAMITVTRSEAWITPSGDALVKVFGIGGGYLLGRVSPIDEKMETSPTQAGGG